MTKTRNNKQVKEIDFEEWITGCVDPIIKEVESLINYDILTPEQKAVKVYWSAFAQNTINLSRQLAHMPHHFSQIMMTFRILQESSADIFYLKNHPENIARLAQIEGEIENLKSSDNFSMRTMSWSIAKTDIRSVAEIQTRKNGTQSRIKAASAYLEESLGKGLTADLGDINKLLNGYTHFNPTGIYLLRNLTDHGYVEIYLKLLYYYPTWLYLVLVSLSDLLNIKELGAPKSKKIIDDLLERIEESHEWKIEGFAHKGQYKQSDVPA